MKTAEKAPLADLAEADPESPEQLARAIAEQCRVDCPFYAANAVIELIRARDARLMSSTLRGALLAIADLDDPTTSTDADIGVSIGLARAQKAVQESMPERAAPEWIAVANLPDSDIPLVLIDARIGRDSIAFGELEFTDDSEGQGRPYWETTGGEKPIETFTHWHALREIPK